MKAISLFSGVGGLDLGLERAGIETVLQVEQDEYCRRVLAKHWPDVERFSDVRDVGHRGLPWEAERGAGSGPRSSEGDDVHFASEWSRACDLIHGGFPCQDVSVAGKRAGLSGDRSGLWFEFARILGELRPRWLLIENVPGLLSSNQGRDFAVILNGLDKLGFDAAWGTLDAQHFGVPQRRRRVFIVGGLRDAGCGGPGPSAVLALREGSSGDSPASREAGPGVAYASLSGLGNGGPDDNDGQAGRLIAIRTAQTGSNGWGVNEDGIAYTLDSADQAIYVPDVAYAIVAREAKGVSLLESQTNYVAPAGGVRRLTPTECERLQGFPDGWTDGFADSHRYRQLGNAVAVPVAEWIGHRLMAVDALTRQEVT